MAAIYDNVLSDCGTAFLLGDIDATSRLHARPRHGSSATLDTIWRRERENCDFDSLLQPT